MDARGVGLTGVRLLVTSSLLMARGLPAPVRGDCTLGLTDLQGRPLSLPYTVPLVSDAAGIRVGTVGLAGSGWTGRVTIQVVGPDGEAEDRQFPQFTEHDTPGVGLLEAGHHELTVRDQGGCEEFLLVEVREPRTLESGIRKAAAPAAP